MNADEIKELIAEKISDLQVEPEKITIHVCTQTSDKAGDLKLLSVTANVEHPDFQNLTISMTFKP